MSFVITIALSPQNACLPVTLFFPNEKHSNGISNIAPSLAEILGCYDWVTRKTGVSTPDV